MNMTASDVGRALADRAEQTAKYLLPAGKRSGAEWCVGSTGGEHGDSLRVHLTGTKAGVWADFASGESGDLLDLWAAVRGLSIGEAMRDAKAYLGLPAEPAFAGTRKATYRRPEAKELPRGSDSKAFRYLTGERQLTPETLEVFKVGCKDSTIALPSYRDGELLFVKYLAVDRDERGKKRIRVEAECEPVLFGWQAIPVTARTVTITEGEIDAMTLSQAGIPALSVPFGGGTGNKQRWIETEFEHLARFDTIHLALDSDAEGEAATAEIVERLGRHRCRVVAFPEGIKDANQYLQSGAKASDFARLVDRARTLDPAELKAAADYADDVVARFYPPDDAPSGWLTPWKKLDGKLALRPGEVSIVAGYNGHGKSQLVGHTTLGLLRQGVRACIASMEFRPDAWLARLTRQAAAARLPSPDYIRAIHRWYDGRLWVAEVTGRTKAETLIGIFDYARRRYAVEYFVIDNLAKCGLHEDDYNGQKDLIDALTDFARDHQVHVTLVAHNRKGATEMTEPDKMDLKGTGGLSDMADTLIQVWRNKPKENAFAKAETEAEKLKLGTLPDAKILVAKQRNGEWEGSAALWFDPDTFQFLSGPDCRSFAYVNWSIDEPPHVFADIDEVEF